MRIFGFSNEGLQIGILGVLLSGCAQLENLSKPVEDPSRVKVRQEILLSANVFGVKEHLQNKKILVRKRQKQAVKVEPLLERLREKNEQEILTLLGKPERKIHEGDTRVWQYVTQVCQWDMYFMRGSGTRDAVLRDVIIHFRGEILTETAEIKECENALQKTSSLT